MVWFMYYPLWYCTVPNPGYSVLGSQDWVHLSLSSLFPFLVLSRLTSELRFYDGWVVYALISFPFYVLPYSLAKNSPFLYQANFASRIDGTLPVLGGVRAHPLLIQQVIPRPWEVLGLSHDCGLGVEFMPFLVRCPIGIDWGREEEPLRGDTELCLYQRIRENSEKEVYWSLAVIRQHFVPLSADVIRN
jgi:hypothetical protein